jgi:serine/threonine protein kinase/ABC-type phosphate transport system substrate-binding protein
VAFVVAIVTLTLLEREQRENQQNHGRQPAMNPDNTDATNRNNYNSIKGVGDYILQEPLGGGENSTTFKGICKTTGEIVAVKVLPKSFPMAKNLYDAEISAYKALKGQPGILTFKDHGEDDEVHFLVTEYIPDGSLRNILKNYPKGMDFKDAINLFTLVANAIDLMHEKHVIHRDLKPENILVSVLVEGYKIFIADFGVIKITTASQGFQTGSTAGTSLYIAPEALFGDPDIIQSKAIDIYAMGVMLYEALEGKLPYEDIDKLILYKQHPLPPTHTIQKAGETIAGLLLKTFHYDPTQRPDSAKEAINKLKEKQTEGQKWIGRKVNNYKVEEVLGENMGITLRASDLGNNKQVVLKVFAHSEKRNNEAYKKEINSLSKLEDGHGVLKPLEIFDYENTSFIVTEYQSGGTLRNLLTRRPKVPTDDMMEIFTQIAEAVDYIHEKKIVHRDIKPENIVYSIYEGKIIPFITDFGISAILASTQGFFSTHHIGTRRYMAPELRDEKTKGTKAVDIYAFGVMLYEALEGYGPFENPTSKRKQSSKALTADKTQKELGVNAKNILLQALALDAEERPKTAIEIMHQIRKLGQHEMILGKKYGKYTIENFVGRGTYGTTYRAHIAKGRKKLAFKVLSIQQPNMQEVEILKNLAHHDGIASILDGGSENGIHYIVTDYYNGISLRDELQSYPSGMDLDEVLKLFKPIAKAIDYLHDTGMAHGDMKPENVILCKNKNDIDSFDPVITGFGISKIVGNIQQFLSNNNYNYIAPELWRGGEPSSRSDIYAFGIMLYEALEGTPPFNAKSLADKMNQHLIDRPPFPKNIFQFRGKKGADAILQSLNKNPELRQANAQALITQLEDKTQDNTSTTLGRITEPLKRVLKPLINASRKKFEFSLSNIAIYTILVTAIVVLLSRPLAQPLSPVSTPSITSVQTTTTMVSIVETTVPGSATPATLTPTSTPHSIAMLDLCNSQYDIPQEGCIYKADTSISMDELYKIFYKRFLVKTQTRYDEVAIAYFNNRKAWEETGFDMIDFGTFSIKKGQTIFLPHPDLIEEYREFPIPVLEAMDLNNTNSEITISGSSTLYPLSSKIKERFVNVAKTYQINIKSNNTKQGLSDFCKGRAEIFSASEGKLQNCPQVTFLKFEIARYAVVIYVSDQNPYKKKLEEHPLTGSELLKLLTSAKSWKDVREELDPKGESVINRYYPLLDSGAFEIVNNMIFPNIDSSSLTNLNNIEDEHSIPNKVEGDIYSVGFSSYFDYQKNRDDLFAIPVNGVDPNRDTIEGENPEYPLTRQLYLYTGKDTYYGDSLLRFFINYYISYELDYLDELGYFHPNKTGFLYNIPGNPIR